MELLLHNVIIPMLLIGGALLKLGGLLGESEARILYLAIDKTAANPEKSKIDHVLGKCFDGCFASDKGAFAFILHVFFITLVSLLISLSFYTLNNKGLLEQFASVGFLRQFLFQGFLSVYIIIFLSYSYYPRLKNNFDVTKTDSISYLLFQVFSLNAALFVLLTVFIHVAFYSLGWSGHSSLLSIINSIWSVLLPALSFKSLTGIYFYAVMLSIFPVFLMIFIRLLISSESLSGKLMPYLYCLGFKATPLRAIVMLFTVFVGMLSLLLSLIVLAFTAN
ncbi:hypothetical protein [Thalassomonas sp. RHCl1]|uniref:hypothetical protein n=1 Tax=Thalassomonas sp. RHCl1 TaxID=2995320 RepID=UPI00248BFB21|nr:hypothetical protein [Thalassomonas sp. RHCl1]